MMCSPETRACAIVASWTRIILRLRIPMHQQMITHGIRKAGKSNIEPPMLRVLEAAQSVRSLLTRKPQSMQSVPMLHIQYSEPGPPSSHSPSDNVGQVWSVFSDEQPLGPQSEQSVPIMQLEFSAPLPPSSHTPFSMLGHSATLFVQKEIELEATVGLFCALAGLKPRRENVISTNLCTLCPLT